MKITDLSGVFFDYNAVFVPQKAILSTKTAHCWNVSRIKTLYHLGLTQLLLKLQTKKGQHTKCMTSFFFLNNIN
jgi:hypothetical protein